MPNIDTLSINFKANGTDRAVTNIKNMAGAVKELSMSVRLLDVNKMETFSQAMNNLKKSAPTKAQTDRMNAFVKTITASDLKTLDGEKLNSFAQSIETVKKALPGKQKTEQMTAFFNAISANSGQNLDFTKLGTLAATLDAIKKATPTKSQIERMTEFAGAVTNLSNAIASANIGGFANDMSILSQAVQAFKKSSVNSIANAVAAMQTLGQQAQQTASTINNATPKNSQGASMGDNKGALDNTKELVATLDRVYVKANGIAGILQKLGIVTPTKQFKTLEENAEKIRVKYQQLRDTLQKALDTGEITSGSTEYKKKMAELDALRNKYDELIQKQRELARNGGFEINPNITKALQSVSNFGNALRNANSSLQGIAKGVSNFIGKVRNLGTSSRKAEKDTIQLNAAVKKLGNEFFRVSKMLKLMITRMALRKVIAEVGNGFKSLALHSDEFNRTMSSMIAASKKLGYSFSAMVAPLIQALAPALIYFLNILTRIINAINQIFSALTGKSTYNKAKDFVVDWADDLEDANKEAKELKKSVLGFDELNQLTDNKSTANTAVSDIKDMFDTVAIEAKWKKVADYIKKLASKLFEPIKKAWKKVGDFVKKSWKYAMNEVLKLGKSIARDFWKVWNQKKTQKIFENILKIIGYIGQAVGNLAKRFREAWDKNDTGLRILEKIRDIVLVVTKHLKKMAKATADWADSLDFEPMLTAFADWLESLEPVIDALMGVLSDFYETVILPLGKWAIEVGTPKLLKVFQDFNKEVDWIGLRKKLKTLWKYLEKFGETVGEGLIIFIDRCADAVARFLNSETFENFLITIENWMESVTPQDVADGLEAICKAILGFAAVKAVLSVLSAITGFITTVKACGGVLKLAITIAVAYEGFKLGSRIGKWLTGEDELYDTYDLTATLKWVGAEIPTSLTDFGEKLLEWRDAWHQMMEDTNIWIASITQGIDTIMKGPIGSLLDRLAWFKEKKPDEARDMASGILGTAGGDLGHYIEQAQEAIDKTNELNGSMNGMPSDVWNKLHGNVSDATTGIQKNAEETKGLYDTVVKGFIALVNDLGNASTVKSMDWYQSIKDAFKLNQLEKDLDAGKISIEEFWQAIKGLDASAQTKGANDLLSRYMDELKDLKELYDKGTISTQEYQHELSNIRDKYKVVVDGASKYKTGIKDITKEQEGLQGSLGDTNEKLKEVSSTVKDSKSSFKDYYDGTKYVTQYVPSEIAGAQIEICGAYKEISRGATDSMTEVKKTVNESMGSVKKDTDTTTSDMGKDWQNAQKTITDATSGLSKATTDSMGDIKKSVDDSMKDVNKSLDSVKDGLDEKDWTFEGVAKGLKKTFEDAESGIKSIWNRIADKLNGEHEIGGGSFRINLPKFARGGFVEDGLFLANHHELVGTFSNGKTAVANNTQIVDGISAGVYNAVSRAMSQQGGQSKYISNTIVVDGDVIARTVTKAQEKQNARYSPAY